MAIIPIHRRITKDVLANQRFGTWACDWAASANAAVDEKQGQTSDQTNLHAMRGIGKDGAMQSYEAAVEAVRRLIEDQKTAALEAIKMKDFEAALAYVGQAHHTIQDREYHRFEPWPYAGLVDSVLNAAAGARYGLSSDYMVGHLLRDLSVVSGLEYGAHYASGSGFAGHYWLELSVRTGRGFAPYLSVGSYGIAGVDGRRGEIAGYVAVTWGAPPRSVRSAAAPLPVSVLGTPMPRRSFCEEAGEGLGAYERGLASTRRFMEEVEAAAGADDYARFRASVNARDLPSSSVAAPGDEPLLRPKPFSGPPGAGHGPSRAPVMPRT